MAEQIGAKIREARTAAGMSQKALAEAVGDISASSISRAERGLKELTDEQLEAIAKATGSESLLGEVKEEAPKAAEVKEEAPETPEADKDDANPMAAMMGMLGGMMSGKADSDPLGAVAGVLGGMMGGGEGLDMNTVGAIAGMLGKMMG